MFTFLYGDDVRRDAASVLIYINDLAEGVGVTVPLEIDIAKLTTVLRAIRHDFPHKDGLEKASVFKKVAMFIVNFIAEAPIISKFPEGTLSPELRRLAGHQNAVVAFEISIDALHHAIVKRDGNGGGEIELKNRIDLSKHSYADIVQALCGATAATHFQLVCVLLEQLAYRANPDASYPLMGA